MKPASSNVKRWRVFALLAVAYFMTIMKNATANSPNARQRLMFGVSRTGLSAIVITASFVVITLCRRRDVAKLSDEFPRPATSKGLMAYSGGFDARMRT